MPQRVWHIPKCAVDFKVFLPPRPVDTSSISYTVLLKLTIAELEHAWSRAFARHACILQKCIDQSSAAATTYGELADRFLSLLQQPDSHFYFFAPTDVSDNGTEFILRSSIEGLSLQEILRYCPGRLADDKAVLFIIFQVVRALSLLHSLNIPHLGLSLQNIFVDSDHKCILGPPNLFALQKQKECNRKKYPSSDCSARYFGGAQMLPAKISELSLMTTQWTMCKISNYDYLMFLNRLAGRHQGDPSNSAVLPWVTSFSSPDGELRDLTKSKYRLTKGEAQLDANYSAFSSCTSASLTRSARSSIADDKLLSPIESDYDGMIGELHDTWGIDTPICRAAPSARCSSDVDAHLNTSDDNRVSPHPSCTRTESPQEPENEEAERPQGISFQPHHLLDMMPDLAYYTYTARRTQKSVLTRYVRPVYRPHEFPSNMARLYESTPDECIPEFFNDPTVFTSIHPDMPDLGLPPWCSGPEEFISYHRSMLECDEVSSKLHHWIDITFGYKLLGEDAVKAKNVHLELTEDQTTPRRTGVTCLFRTPHPNRGSPSQSVYFGSTLPFHTLISCPKPTTAAGAISSSTTDTTTVTSEGHDSSKDLNETQNPTCHFSDPVISHSLDNENCTLELPPDYDPLGLINSYSHLCQFLATETHNTSLLEIPKIAEQSPHSVSLNDLFGRDIEAVACLVVELFTHPVFNYIEADQWSHEYRVSIARSSARTYWTRIPFCLRRGVEMILQPFSYEEQMSNFPDRFIPSAWQLLQVIFEFPSYMFDLFEVTRWLSGYSPDSMSPALPFWGPLSLAFLPIPLKVPKMFESKKSEYFPMQVLDMLQPYLTKAFDADPTWFMDALCSDRLLRFFASVGGIKAIRKHLFPLILKLYNPKTLKNLNKKLLGQQPLSTICSRRFLRRLLTYVGAKTFIRHMPSRIILGLLDNSVVPLSVDQSREETSVGHESPSPQGYSKNHPRALDGEESGASSVDDFSLTTLFRMQHVAKGACVDRVHRSAEFDLDVDEIGVDLRSLEAEEEILQIMKTSKSQDNASLSMCSKTSSTSDDPERVHFYSGPEDSSKEIPIPSSFVSRLGDEPASNTKVVKSRGSPRIPSIRPSSGPLLPTKVLSAHQMQNNSAIPPAAASTDSIIWLAKRIGPLQTAHRLVKYLLATLITCYETENQLSVLASSDEVSSSSHTVVNKSYLPMGVQSTDRPLTGDRSAAASLRCLEQLVCVYGVSFVLDVYIPFVTNTVESVLSTLNVTEAQNVDQDGEQSESLMDPLNAANSNIPSAVWSMRTLGRFVAALSFLHQFITYLPDSYLSDQLRESSIQDLLIKAIRIAGRHDVTFPGGVVGRQACLYKIIDCIYVLGLRVGFEMTRTQLTPLFQLFFALFDRVPKPLDDMPQVRPLSTTSPSDKPGAVSGRSKSSEELNHRRGSNVPGTVNFIKPAVVLELQATFNKELARLAYIPFCRLAGGVFIDTCLYNTASVRALVSDDSGGSVPLSASSRSHSDQYSEPSSVPAHTKTTGTDATSVAASSAGFSQPQLIDRTQEMNLVASSSLYNDGGFHLRGMWSDVFRQELRASQNSDPLSKSRFRFHATRVASFVGHTAKVNSIDVMDTQNCFVTCSQDKTVQLWSLTDSYNPTYCMPPASTVISKSLTANSSAHSTLGPSSSGRNTPTDSFSAGNGSSSSGGTHIARLIFREHKKSVFAACYLSNYRLVASVDGHLILWDPCTGQKVHSGLGSRTLTALGRCSTPYGAIFCGDDAGSIYLVDPRAPVCSKSNLLRIDSGTRLAYAFLTKHRTKSANPVDGISNISQCSFNDYCSRLSGAHGDAFSQRLSALFCSVHPTSSHRTPSCSPSCNSVPVNCAGVLRHLVESEESRVLVCGFSSGFMTAIDLRTHQVVQAWRGHGDSVLALTESPQPTWFVSAGDRSLGFWHVKQSGEFTCLRTNDHCVTRSFATSEPVASSVGNLDMPEASFSPVPGMNHINCLCPNERELIVCGPPVPSGPSVSNVAAAVVAAVSSSTNSTDSLSSSPSSHPAQLRSVSTNSGNQSNPVSTNGDILGVYFSSGTGLPIAYNSLGRISSSLMRGHATSISSLSQTGLFLVGSSQGAISLLY